MRSELERLGTLVRGREMTDAQLAALLREHGYDVSEKPAPKKQEEDSR